MEIDTIFEYITSNPWCYFIAGLLIGYGLRLIFSEYRTRRPGRYHSKKLPVTDKRVIFSEDLQEPSFDLPDAVLKSFTAQRVNNSVVFDHKGSEPSL